MSDVCPACEQDIRSDEQELALAERIAGYGETIRRLRNLLHLMVDRLELEGVTRADLEAMSGWDKDAAAFLEWRE